MNNKKDKQVEKRDVCISYFKNEPKKPVSVIARSLGVNVRTAQRWCKPYRRSTKEKKKPGCRKYKLATPSLTETPTRDAMRVAEDLLRLKQLCKETSLELRMVYDIMLLAKNSHSDTCASRRTALNDRLGSAWASLRITTVSNLGEIQTIASRLSPALGRELGLCDYIIGIVSIYTKLENYSI